jgi:hypothetical protein
MHRNIELPPSHITTRPIGAILLLVIALGRLAPVSAQTDASKTSRQAVAGGAQYDTAHVYIAPDQLDAFITSFITTFGGHATSPIVTNVLPTPSTTAFQAVATPVGNLSVFAYQTPIPFPFGQERTGYLVTDLDQAIQAARKAGAEVIVAPFQDAIGRDAVIQWPGGIKMQLYWHFKPPTSAPLQTIPENRVYLSPDRADEFVRDFLRFSQGRKVSDDLKADAAEIGRPGALFRRIQIESGFGKMLVLVTDGHLPYPFGYDLTGYEVRDLSETLTKAKTAGVRVLSELHSVADRTTAILEFPGGYIAEVHAITTH